MKTLFSLLFALVVVVSAVSYTRNLVGKGTALFEQTDKAAHSA